MMSCLDCFQKLYVSLHPHILTNGLSEPLPGATHLNSCYIPGPCNPPSHQNLTPGVEIWVGSDSRMAPFREQQKKSGLEGEGSG